MTRLSKIARRNAVSPRKRTSKVKRNFKNSTPREKGPSTPPTIHTNAVASSIRYIPSQL